jgi:hypothetical protein
MKRLGLCLGLGMMMVASPFVWAGGVPAAFGVIEVTLPVEVYRGGTPGVSLKAKDRPAVYVVECTVGDKVQSHTSGEISAGMEYTVRIDVKEPMTKASCAMVARFANGLSERRQLDLQWKWVDPPPPEEPGGKDGKPSPDQPVGPETKVPKAK